jgi:DNA-binding SARP family transcriptional activator/pimeloyl-ACP methyl ester carboxylesterase
MGYPGVLLDGCSVALGLRKALALLAYLAIEDRPVRRDEIAELLWPEMDGEEVARARLRRTLHKLQLATNGTPLIATSRATLCMTTSFDLHVDAVEFEVACDAGEFERALDHYGGDFLAGFNLDDCPEFEEWVFYRREALRSRLMQALEKLIERKLRDREYREAASVAHRLVGLDPLNEAGHRHLIRSCMMAGDCSAAERHYDACERLLAEELGVVPEAQTRALLTQARSDEKPYEIKTRYAERSGIHIAYQTVGSGKPDLLLIPGFVSHIERTWEDSSARHFLNRLAEMGRLIVFDRRGVGLSDRIGFTPTVDATAEDIETVLGAVGSRQTFLIGCSEGGPSCIRFAASSPEKLHGLILYGSPAKGCRSEDYPFALTREQYDLWLRNLIENWENAADIETFAPSVAKDRQVRSWWTSLLRAASSPGTARGVLEAFRDCDVRHLLPDIKVPTLVLHRRGDRAVRIEAGRHLADAIPDAWFVELDGKDHWPWIGDTENLLTEISCFLREACPK